MSSQPLSSFNVFHRIQQDICDVINQSPVIQDAGVEFIAENSLEVDYQIRESLKKQGLAAIVMTPDAEYLGHNGDSEAYQLNNLTVQFVEYTPMNRASNKEVIVTGLDLANYTSELLGGPNSVVGFGKLCPNRLEQGEEQGLLVTKLTFNTCIQNGDQPVIYVPFVTRDELDGVAGYGMPRSVKRLGQYIYKLTYDQLDQSVVGQIPTPTQLGGCSSIRDGEEWARNYDWNLDESPTFVVELPGNATRYASISTCRGLSSSTEDRVVERELVSAEWKTIPFLALDGVNEWGVICNVNVVSRKDDENWSGRDFPATIAVRKVLDKARTAEQGANLIADCAFLPDLGEWSLHFMVCDQDETWIVEDGIATNITEREMKVMTNFRICAGEFLTNGQADPAKISIFDPYGSGLERWDLLAQGGCDQIWEAFFTKAYVGQAPGRITEFASKAKDIKLSDPWALTQEREKATLAWPSHTRDGKFWQTVHSSRYDYGTGTWKLVVQEDTSKEWEFQIGI